MVHIFGSAGAEVERSGHAEGLVEFFGGIGIDGVGAGGVGDVLVDVEGRAAANYYDGSLRRQRGGREEKGEGAEVFLTILSFGSAEVLKGWDEGEKHTPQKKCRMKTMR